jgi:hypothetical protein
VNSKLNVDLNNHQIQRLHSLVEEDFEVHSCQLYDYRYILKRDLFFMGLSAGNTNISIYLVL